MFLQTVRSGDQCLLDDSVTEVKLRRVRLVPGRVTAWEDWALWSCVRSSVWTLICDDRPNSRYRADTDVNEMNQTNLTNYKWQRQVIKLFVYNRSLCYVNVEVLWIRSLKLGSLGCHVWTIWLVDTTLRLNNNVIWFLHASGSNWR
jgi:hypothetical protein